MTVNLNKLERLNLGCGPNAPDGWVNLDGSWNAWFANHRHLRKVLESVGLVSKVDQGPQWSVRPLVHDLRKPLPFRENTFSAIYGSHVLEHLYLADAQCVLSECKRILKPGGVLRLVVPDLHSMVLEYLKKKNGNHITLSEKSSAADHLNERLRFRSPAPPEGNFLFKFYAISKDFHSHKWMYDSESLARYLELAGFEKVAEREFLNSDIPDIKDVEDPERVLDGAGICIEGKKGNEKSYLPWEGLVSEARTGIFGLPFGKGPADEGKAGITFMFSSGSVLGRMVRFPLSFVPTELVVPVLRGPLRGSKWIVGSSLHGWWLGSFEHKKQTRLASALKPSSIFYDIGANAGFYSLLAARLVTTGKIYAFEPLQRNVSYLQRHLKLNRISNVEVLELAVSDRTGMAFFQEGENSLMGHLTQKGNIRVRTATLDSLLLGERIFPPDVIKMDIEGTELFALRGASECIQRYRPVIFLATHGCEVHQTCCGLLESWGYECELLGGSTANDRGEVVARPRR